MTIDITQPLALLGGLSPRQFMKRHWQKKPLLVRGALPGFSPLLERSRLFELAASDGVESRLVEQRKQEKSAAKKVKGQEQGVGSGWRVRHGPFVRRALPPLSRPLWTLLVQGVDLHDDAVHDLMRQFRFVPDARLDDLMISFATDGGGVGPHFDSYDVFLLQAHGRRRWRIGRQSDLQLRDDVPLKILAHFEPEEEYVLEPGDMLYLPPRYAHDGIAEGECQTYSIGFRSPARAELARELLQRLADGAEEEGDAGPATLYRDPAQPAVAGAGAVPEPLQTYAREAVARALRDPLALQRSLGEYLTEPKANVWFDEGAAFDFDEAITLDRRTRMMYDAHHVFINGESYRASGRDARLMQALADARRLSARELRGASEAARELLQGWADAGWLGPDRDCDTQEKDA